MSSGVVVDVVTDARSDRSGAATARRRRAILEAAITIFAERGYEGSSTREIADAVGLKQGHLYYYFPAKQDLLFAVIDGLHDAFLEGADIWVAAAEPGDELRTVLVGHVATVCRNHRAAQVSYENTRFLDDDRRNRIVLKRNRYEASIVDLVAARLAPSADSARLVTRAVLGTVNWTYQWYSDSGPLGPQALGERLAALALAMVDHAAQTPTS